MSDRTYDLCKVESITEVAPDAVRVEFSGCDSRRIAPGFVNHIVVPVSSLHGCAPIRVGEIIEVSHFSVPEVARRYGSELIWINEAGISHKA